MRFEYWNSKLFPGQFFIVIEKDSVFLIKIYLTPVQTRSNPSANIEVLLVVGRFSVCFLNCIPSFNYCLSSLVFYKILITVFFMSLHFIASVASNVITVAFALLMFNFRV